ncbi:MAG: HsdM family class I SAM-dependent methyltransferase [Lewinella sp.]|uniref:HsdM family class I SAM-dependent methyltransferase n=1 Tax=Lewinella sp. TaxID=2004506 RepID=UPI003D6A1045
MNTSSIKKIIGKHSINGLESGIIRHYLQRRGISAEDSHFLSSYLDQSGHDESIESHELDKLGIETIKDLEHTLELLIPKEDRKLNGAFFTPDYIVDHIIDEVGPSEDDLCADLSCGCGAFLLGLVRYFQKKYQKTILEIVSENVFGADILEYNIRRAKLLLSIYALENGEVLREEDFNLLHIDSLRHVWEREFDVVVGNPPYVKYQDLDDENREYLIHNWKTIKVGTFNMYFAFFELGYRLLKETGRLGYITPNNYFTSLAGESLRVFFQQQECIYKIIDFSHHKVFDAQTYTTLTFINKKNNREILFDRINGKYKPEGFLKNVDTSPNPLSALSTKKWRLLKSEERKVIHAIENVGTPLSRLFKIYVGIATLKDQLFFIDGSREEEGCYVKDFDGVEYHIEKDSTRAIFKISDFKKSSDFAQNQRRIVFPYRIVKGKGVPLEESDMERLYPKTLAYFRVVREELKKREKKGQSIDPFYIYGRSQGLTRTGKKILTPTFSRYPRFTTVDDEEALFCNGYGLFFQEPSGGLFDQEPITKVENIQAVEKILNSYLMHYYVSKTSVSIQGGYPCYQKNFIQKFSIPFLAANEVSFLNTCTSQKEVNEFLIKKYGLELDIPADYYLEYEEVE